jgi:hypothetical protein
MHLGVLYLQATVDCLEDSVRRLGQHNAHLVQQIKGSLSAPGSVSTGMTAALSAANAGAVLQTPTSATPASAGATARSKCDDEAGKQATDSAAAAAVATMSPRTIHSIIAAATRVNAKNKRLKRQLQLALQARPA